MLCTFLFSCRPPSCILDFMHWWRLSKITLRIWVRTEVHLPTPKMGKAGNIPKRLNFRYSHASVRAPDPLLSRSPSLGVSPDRSGPTGVKGRRISERSYPQSVACLIGASQSTRACMANRMLSCARFLTTGSHTKTVKNPQAQPST